MTVEILKKIRLLQNKTQQKNHVNTVTISWHALPSSTYQLYYGDSMTNGVQWSAVPGSCIVTDGIATQTFTIGSGATV